MQEEKRSDRLDAQIPGQGQGKGKKVRGGFGKMRSAGAACCYCCLFLFVYHCNSTRHNCVLHLFACRRSSQGADVAQPTVGRTENWRELLQRAEDERKKHVMGEEAFETARHIAELNRQQELEEER